MQRYLLNKINSSFSSACSKPWSSKLNLKKIKYIDEIAHIHVVSKFSNLLKVSFKDLLILL